MTSETTAIGAGSPSPSTPLLAWSVHVIVCGLYAGAYKFATEADARADADDRRHKFGVLGCRYIVEANATAETRRDSGVVLQPVVGREEA